MSGYPVEKLDAATLRELAAIAEQRERTRPSAWQLLPVEAVDEALAMIADGHRLALGWWRDRLPAPDTTPAWPTPIPTIDTGRRWAAWELVAAAVDMADTNVDQDITLDVLATLAVNHGLGDHDLADAYRAVLDPPQTEKGGRPL